MFRATAVTGMEGLIVKTASEKREKPEGGVLVVTTAPVETVVEASAVVGASATEVTEVGVEEATSSTEVGTIFLIGVGRMNGGVVNELLLSEVPLV